MRKILFGVVIAAAVVIAVLPAYTQEAEKTGDLKKTPEEMAPALKAKVNAVMTSVQILNNLEMRVAVLQQLLQEETAKLRQMEAVFCDQNDLNLEKYRAKKYSFNTSTGEFTEITPPAAVPAP